MHAHDGRFQGTDNLQGSFVSTQRYGVASMQWLEMIKATFYSY